MDPDENLRQQRKIAAEMLRARDKGGWTSFDDVARLCELVQALDEWIVRGGSLPGEWTQEAAPREWEKP